MIYPLSIIDRIIGRKFIWIQGVNRSGKTALAVDISREFLKSNWRLISNLNCVWNEQLPIELDSNLQLNCVVILDEGGIFMRTKESIRHIMGAKGKLNCVFLMPSTEEPHEDLWNGWIEPAERLNNWFVKKFLGVWVYENLFKIWKFVEFDASSKDGFRKTIFFQIHPKAVYYLYSTLIIGHSADDILSQFRQSLEDQQAKLGNTNSLGFHDVATGRTGVGETSSFSNQQVTTFAENRKRKLLSTKGK